VGDFSMTCSLSGLSIPGGTPVRCLLLTASPYGEGWLVRTPPLRATYDSYGSIEQVHEGDKFIADLWLRGLREDLIERGLGDNSVHDVPTARDMSFEQLLHAVRASRVAVRRDIKHFWRRPLADDLLDGEIAHEDRLVPTLRTIEDVLARDGELVTSYPEPVSRGACSDKFAVDEPVPHLVRVRFGRYQHGSGPLDALNAAHAAVTRAGFVGVVAAGSGRYANDADLLVLPAPNPKEHVLGPQWDMARGQPADEDKPLPVAMAMIREDVWQALSHYPHENVVSLDCSHCGQQSCYHGKTRECPDKSINNKPLRQHPEGSTYAHGPVFPDGIEHVVVPRDYGENVWYGLEAFRAGTRSTWTAILDHFSGRRDPDKEDLLPSLLPDAFWENFRAAAAKEAERVAKLPAEEQAKLEAARRARCEAREAKERDRRENPRFGDFLIDDMIVTDSQLPGAWLFRDSTPGVIGIPAHLSMCLADKREVPMAVLDAIAELSAVNRSMGSVGVTWKPAVSTGPQYPEWDQHLRFARTLVTIAEANLRRESDNDEPTDTAYATLSDVPRG